jgi:hypothetical protein
MNPIIKKEIEDFVEKCNSTQFPMMCKKTQFKEGKELVVNMVYNRLKSFPNWNINNAVSDVEIYLNDLENE